MGDLVVFDRSTNQFRRAIEDDSPVEIIRLSTESDIQGFLLLPISIEEARSITVQDDDEVID